MHRLAESRSAVTACRVLVVVAAIWGLIAARWVPDWLTSPHYRATITRCEFFYEVPTDQSPRSCYSKTAEGVVYIYGAGQGEVGDELSYFLTDDQASQPNGQPIAYSPTLTDWALVAAALTTLASTVLGLAAITYSRARRRRSQRHTPPATALGVGA